MEHARPKAKKKKTWIIVLVVVIAAAAIGGYFIWQNTSKSNFAFDQLAQDGFLEGRSDEEIQALVNQVVEEGMFNISMNSNPVFENGREEGNLRIENVPANKYYMTVRITLDDTGEVVYESAGIKQGQFIEKAALNKNLVKGEYAATAVFTAVEPNSLKETGQASANIVLTVLN